MGRAVLSSTSQDPVARSSKLKFLALQVFCAVCVDFAWCVWRLLTGRVWRTETTHVCGSDAAKAFFCLDKVDQLPYTDPAYSGHVGTILCSFRPHRHPPYERVHHPGADGNPMCVDWCPAAEPAAAKGVFVVIPGLASWSGTNYIEHFVWFAREHNFHCCVFNSRGMGDTVIEKPRLMSAKWTDDLRALMCDGPLTRAAIEQRCGTGLPIVGVGFSLGGVILGKFVGEEGMAGRSTALDAVMIVNSPLDCVDSSVRMERVLQRVVYQPSMIGGLTAYARRHAKVLKDLPGLEAGVQAAFAKGQHDDVLGQMKTVRDFDRVITAPTVGFATPEEYYHHISPITWLPHYKMPVLCISTLDDPVCGPPPMAALRPIMAANANVALLTIPHGGHLGYIRSVKEEWVGMQCFLETVVFDIVTGMAARK